MQEVKAYQCEYCKKKILKSYSGMYHHEKKCYWNSETKSCMTCENFITGGHYPSRCEFACKNTKDDCGNTKNKYNNSQYSISIKNLQHDCDLYKYDALSFEERKAIVDDANSDARADWDDYHATIL